MSKIKKLDKSRVQFELQLTDEDLKKYEDQACKKLSGEVKVDGFRKGKVPKEMLREKLGEEYIKAYTLDIALPRVYADFIVNNNINVIARPEIKETKNTPPTFEVTVAVYPEVTIGNYQKIKIKQKALKVSKKQVDDVIDNIQKRNAEYVEVDRAAKNKDKVEIDFEGFDKEGKAIERTASKNHPLIIGENMMIPGFEDNIVGMKKGEEKSFDITFPKDYHAKELQSAKVTFKIKLNKVEEVKLPEIDEAFIEKITGKKTKKDDFLKDVEKQILSEMEREDRVEREKELIDEVVKITKVDLPEAMIEQEVHHMMEELKRKIAMYNMTMDHYLQHHNLTEEKLKENYTKEANERVKAKLGFSKILDEEKIEASDKDIDKEIEHIKSHHQSNKEKKQVEQAYKKGSEMYEELRRRMQMNKLVEKMLAA